MFKLIFDLGFVIFSVVLYGCRMRETHKLRLFERMVLGKIFGHEKDKATGKWRRLHNEELHDRTHQILLG
jgi:hypothetical protein